MVTWPSDSCSFWTADKNVATVNDETTGFPRNLVYDYMFDCVSKITSCEWGDITFKFLFYFCGKNKKQTPCLLVSNTSKNDKIKIQWMFDFLGWWEQMKMFVSVLADDGTSCGALAARKQ